jgi:hypothetical protein
MKIPFVLPYGLCGLLPERLEAVKRVLAIPDTLSTFSIVPCGYPAEERVQQDRFDLKKIH